MGLLNLRLDPIPQLGLETNEITEQSDNIDTHQRTLPQVDSVESSAGRATGRLSWSPHKGPQLETA